MELVMLLVVAILAMVLDRGVLAVPYEGKLPEWIEMPEGRIGICHKDKKSYATVPDDSILHQWTKEKINSVCATFETYQKAEGTDWFEGFTSGKRSLSYCQDVPTTASGGLPDKGLAEGRFSVAWYLWTEGNKKKIGVTKWMCQHMFNGYKPWEFDEGKRQGPWKCEQGGDWCVQMSDGKICIRVDFMQPGIGNWKQCAGSDRDLRDEGSRRAAKACCESRYCFNMPSFAKDFGTRGPCENFGGAG